MRKDSNHKVRSAACTAALCLLFGAVLGVACARLVFLMRLIGREWDPGMLLDFRGDGMSFTGGCAGFTAGICLAAKVRRRDVRQVLDAWAAPGCLLVAAGWIAYYFTGGFGVGDFLGEDFPPLFALTVQDYYGDVCLAVFTLEALTALGVAVWALISAKKKKTDRLFARAVVLLCSAQLFWEMMVSSWIQMFVFCVHLEQVLCGAVLLALIVTWCVKAKKPGPAIVTALMMGLNALMQFVQDKPYYFTAVLPKGIPVLVIVRIVFAVTAVAAAAMGMIAAKRVSQAS